MSEGGIIADFDEIDRCIKRIYKFIKGKKRVRISTDLGTNLELDLTGRRWITDDTGICKDKGDFMTLPAGEIFIAPQELTTSGTLIIDGSFGEVVDEPITVTIRKGYATEFTGGGNVVLELDKRGKEGRNIAEFGIGLNPIAKIIGHKIEDEKVLGTVHIGFGDNSTFGGKVECGVHLDAVIRNPTVTIEDALILERGVLKI
jgi:leucyl aminopeptidase (aminopeptidase T)